MKRAIIVLLIVLLGVGVQAFAFKTGRTYNGKPTYNVDGIEYIVVTDADDNIVWLVGKRIDNRFAVNLKSTSQVLLISMI